MAEPGLAQKAGAPVKEFSLPKESVPVKEPIRKEAPQTLKKAAEPRPSRPAGPP